MKVEPDKTELIGLVDDALKGSLALPSFQRDFVWYPEEVADLLRSILRGYFIGSLLLLRSDPDNPPFAPELLRGIKELAAAMKQTISPKPALLILDGQQRLTSTLYAITAPPLGLRGASQPRQFFVDLDRLEADPDDDDIVIHYTKAEVKKEGLLDPANQFSRRLVPTTALGSDGAFADWLFAFGDHAERNDAALYKEFKDELRKRWNDSISAFQRFMVPVVYLPQVNDDDQDAIGRVCAIFEKLNSTGQDLSVYDLLTARLFKSGIRLHDLWDEAAAEHPRLERWSDGKADKHKFGVLLLRIVALLRDLDPKPKILINLTPKQFEEDWRRAAGAMERALELVELVSEDGFGVFAEKWLPGFGLLPVLAALRAEIDDRKLGDAPRRQLREWYWSSVFLNRYSTAVESISRKDYREYLDHWTKKAPVPSVVAEARARIGAQGYSIADAASHASAIYSGVFARLAIRGARDWKRVEAIQLQQLEDHHLFPRKYLQKTAGFDPKKDQTLVNSILNRTLISDETNRAIGGRAPADYLADGTIFSSSREQLLPQHFIEPEVLGAMLEATKDLDKRAARTSYEAFKAARERDIIDEIRSICGINK